MRLRISTKAIGPWLFACGCGLALVLAAWVRFLPAKRAGDPIVFRADSAFHLRMLTYMIRDGKLPENDPLYHREPPRKLAHVGPPNLYILAAAFFRYAQGINLGPIDFTWLFFLFNSLCGALPVAGCGWLVWEVSGGRRMETLLGMLLSAFATPMVLRSHAGIFRHETLAVGLLLVFAGILLHSIRCGRRPFWNLMAALCLFVGMGFWRLFPFLAALIVLGLLAVELLEKDSFHLRSAVDAAALACLAAGAAYSFYRTNLPSAVLYCLPLLGMPAIYRLIQLPRISAWIERTLPRTAAILAAVIALVLVGSLAVPAIRIRWLAALTSGPLPLTGATLYGVLVEELAPLPLIEAFSASFFLYLPLLLVPPVFLLRGRQLPNPMHRIAATLLLIFLTGTLFVVRFVYLAFPFLLICLIPALSGAVEELKRGLPSRFGRMKTWAVVPLLLLPALGFYLREDLRLSEYLLAPDRDQATAYRWLKWNVRPQENVVSDWSHGYEIQTFSGVRTVTDGFLEDPRNRARILELLSALLSTDESDLVAYMRRNQGNILLLDREYLLPICRRLNLPWQDWFDIQQQKEYTRLTLKPAGKRINYMKCLFDPNRLRGFRVAFNSGNYIVLQTAPAE